MWRIGRPKTSVANYKSTLCNILEERIPLLDWCWGQQDPLKGRWVSSKLCSVASHFIVAVLTTLNPTRVGCHTERNTSVVLLCCEVLWVERVRCSAKSRPIVWGSHICVDEKSVFWDMKPWRLVQRYQNLGGYFCVTFMVVKHYCLWTATLKMQVANNSELLVPTWKHHVCMSKKSGIFSRCVLTGTVFVSQFAYFSVSFANTRCYYYYFQLRTVAFLRLIVRSALDIPTFATRCLHACHHARAPSGGRWNCGREMSGNFA